MTIKRVPCKTLIDPAKFGLPDDAQFFYDPEETEDPALPIPIGVVVSGSGETLVATHFIVTGESVSDRQTAINTDDPIGSFTIDSFHNYQLGKGKKALRPESIPVAELEQFLPQIFGEGASLSTGLSLDNLAKEVHKNWEENLKDPDFLGFISESLHKVERLETMAGCMPAGLGNALKRYQIETDSKDFTGDKGLGENNDLNRGRTP